MKTENENETPSLEFNDYELAFHFAAQWSDAAASKSAATDAASGASVVKPMESYERDLLLYAHRDDPPFCTRVVPVPAAIATLTACFPAELIYESEFWLVRLQCHAAGKTGRRRTFTVLASETIFKRSGIAILSLVLRPTPGASHESQLNEFDLIKLIKLWEGGEGRTASEWENEILFETADGRPQTLEETMRELFPGRVLEPEPETNPAHPSRARLRRTRGDPIQSGQALAFRVGTVELYVPESGRDQLFLDVAAFKEGTDAPEKEVQRARWDRVVAVGGVLQGLLDFRRITGDELEDVFEEVEIDTDDKSLDGFHKGTLLSLSAEEEADPEGEADPDDKRPSPIGVDPYLALPNMVLLHNEQRLKAARQEEQRLSAGQPRRSADQGVTIDDTADGLDAITGLLAQHLPNIFHYANERRLYEIGGRSRGFDDLENLIRLRREELASILQRRERRRDRWTAVAAIAVAVVVAVVAAVQEQFVEGVVDHVTWWILLMLAAFLYVAYRQLWNRLF